MSKNVAQVYAANPVTSIGATDLFYTAASGTTDAAFTGATLKSQVYPIVPNNVTGATQTISNNTGYIANNAAGVAFTLPATAAVGTTFAIQGSAAGGWSIAQNAGQILHVGAVASTAGAGGSVSSSNRYNAVIFNCIVANTEWAAISVVGNLTIV